MMMMIVFAFRLTSNGPTVWTGNRRHLCGVQLNSPLTRISEDGYSGTGMVVDWLGAISQP